MYERSIGFEIRTLANLLKRELDRHQQNGGGLTGTHGWVVGFLLANQSRDIFQRDVEAEFSIRRSTATGILQLMEKNGLIVRCPVAGDARLKKLMLTEKARCLQNQAQAELRAAESRLTQGISGEELELFFHVLDKMKRNIE